MLSQREQERCDAASAGAEFPGKVKCGSRVSGLGWMLGIRLKLVLLQDRDDLWRKPFAREGRNTFLATSGSPLFFDRLSNQLDSKRSHDPSNGVEFGLRCFFEGFVEALS